MNKAQRLANNITNGNHYPEDLDEAAALLRQQDEALRVALEAIEYLNVTAEHKVDNRVAEAAIAKIKEVLHD